jgi:hypothetical protein
VNDIVLDFGEWNNDPVIIIEVYLRREHVRHQTLYSPAFLDGAVALEGKPPSQGKADHGPVDLGVAPEVKVSSYFIFRAGRHDYDFPERFLLFPNL